MKKMNNQDIVKSVVIFLVGALIGWMFTARMYGAGPLASLDGTHSDASMKNSCDANSSQSCCERWGGTWTSTGCDQKGTSTSTKANTGTPPWVPKGTDTSTSSDLLGSTFWITSPDTCERHNATPTGKIRDNLDTGVRQIECRTGGGNTTGN